MAKKKTQIPKYGTITLKGIQYYRTRITDADGKELSLYAATCEELYEKQLEARKQVEEIIFHRQHPTVAEYGEKWLLMQSAKVSASTLRGYTRDTDFMVRLTDVDENGRSIKLADGILSAKYRNGFDHADFLNPGEVVPLTILTTKISNCFKKGHRIRVTITSSAKNFVFPNSNTKDGFNSQTTVVAHNTIFHGGQYPSKITVRMEQ